MPIQTLVGPLMQVTLELNDVESYLMRDAGRAPGMLEVTVSEGLAEEAVLDDAVEYVTTAARAHSMGVMVTQIGKNRFVVRAHPEVPDGLVRRAGWVKD